MILENWMQSANNFMLVILINFSSIHERGCSESEIPHWRMVACTNRWWITKCWYYFVCLFEYFIIKWNFPIKIYFRSCLKHIVIILFLRHDVCAWIKWNVIFGSICRDIWVQLIPSVQTERTFKADGVLNLCSMLNKYASMKVGGNEWIHQKLSTTYSRIYSGDGTVVSGLGTTTDQLFLGRHTLHARFSDHVSTTSLILRTGTISVFIVPPKHTTNLSSIESIHCSFEQPLVTPGIIFVILLKVFFLPFRESFPKSLLSKLNGKGWRN